MNDLVILDAKPCDFSRKFVNTEVILVDLAHKVDLIELKVFFELGNLILEGRGFSEKSLLELGVISNEFLRF